MDAHTNICGCQEPRYSSSSATDRKQTNKQTNDSLVQNIVLGTRKQDLSHVVGINLIDYAMAACAK